MKFDRRVQIRVALRGGEGFGTGYLVAPRLVLTADHVLDDVDPDAGPYAVTVCQPDSDEQKYPATVVWHQQDETVDAALVEIAADCGWPVPESLSDLTARPPQRYGHLIGTRPHRVSLTGFPAMQQHREWGDLDEHLPGQITPGTGSLAGRYEITSKQAIPPNPPDNDGTRWSGISGAAVLADDKYSGDLLCGIVRRDRRADAGTRLTATPISHLLADQDGQPSEFRLLVLQHTGWDPVLEPIEPAPLLKPAAVDRHLDSPAALLRADTAAVAFHGRDRELADLHAWCTEGPAKIAIRVITGPGGQGKTRLARHLTDALRNEGWVTGHLRADLTDRPDRYAPASDLTTLNTALPLLLVVDYAETRPHLLRALITQLFATPYRVRLLLLARSDGGWRTDTLSTTAPVRDLLAAAPVIPLGPLQPAEQPIRDRHEAFRDAARDLALLLPGVPSVPRHDWTALAHTVRPAADLAHPSYDNALTLQMTALVTLLQHGPRPVTANPGDPSEKILLRHEERFWKDSADTDAFELGLDSTTLKAAVAVAALCGADSTGAATRVLATLPAVPTHKTARTAQWLAQLYPADHDRYWGSLQPDRIAEYHASSVLMQGDIELPALLSAAGSDQQAQAVTVLARAAIAHYNADRTTASEDVLHTLDTTLDTSDLSYLALQTASAAIPYRSHVVNLLAVRLSSALTQARQELAHEDPVSFQPALADSLDSLGAHLSQAGRLAEAVTAAEQAVDIYRRLVAEDPTAHEPNLAHSLDSLGAHLSQAGRLAEAVTAAEQAVDIYRRLVAEDPDYLEFDVSVFDFDLPGFEKPDLVGLKRVLDTYRTDFVFFEPALAASLVNLSSNLSKVGRLAEAVTAAEQAADIHRRLAAADPTAYEPGLAASLSILGTGMSETGQQTEALTVTEQAVEIRRRLAVLNPATFEPDFARSLENLGSRLGEAGRLAEAVTAAEQAADIYRRLAAANPAAYEPDLARSLTNLGAQLSRAGRLAEAVTAAEQAVGINRGLAAANPTAYEPGLAASLTNLGSHLSKVGRLAEAVTAAEQAVDIYRRLVASAPTTHEPNFARSLTNLGHWLAKAGRLPESATAIEQTVDIYRRLAAANPTTHEPNLAISLGYLSGHLTDQGHLSEALRATAEAVEYFRTHIAAMPSLLQPLRTVLELQAHLLQKLLRPLDAATVRRWLQENPLPPGSHN